MPDCNIGPLSGVIVTSANMAPIIRKERVESVALSTFTYLVIILLGKIIKFEFEFEFKHRFIFFILNHYAV